MARLLPYGPGRQPEAGICESSDRNTDVLGPQVQVPEHRAAATFTEMEMQGVPTSAQAAVGPVRARTGNAGSREVSTYTEHGSCTPLTLQAVAGDNHIRLAGQYNLQPAAGTARNLITHSALRWRSLAPHPRHSN